MPFLIADNIISSLGFTTGENYQGLLAGNTGIRSVSDPALFREPFQASMVNSGRLEAEFARLDTEEDFTRLEKMMILSIHNALADTDIDITSPKTCLVISTTKGNIDLLAESVKNNSADSRVELWKLGRVISGYFGHPNEPLVVSNACISGVLAINLAAMLIRGGRYHHVVVVGGDLVSRFVVSGFMSFLSLSPKPCRPFDKKRDGLTLGEAAATVVMSSEKKGSNDILWLGGATANDANHISGPSRTGEGSFLAIGRALKEAGITAQEIDHISAHGTATPYNDEMESISISRHGMEDVPVNSMKGYLGHTLGAAGIIESVILANEMRQNTILRSAGYETHGVTKPIHIVKENSMASLNTCLKMASGFGGSNAAMIIEKV